MHRCTISPLEASGGAGKMAVDFADCAHARRGRAWPFHVPAPVLCPRVIPGTTTASQAAPQEASARTGACARCRRRLTSIWASARASASSLSTESSGRRGDRDAESSALASFRASSSSPSVPACSWRRAERRAQHLMRKPSADATRRPAYPGPSPTASDAPSDTCSSEPCMFQCPPLKPGGWTSSVPQPSLWP